MDDETLIFIDTNVLIRMYVSSAPLYADVRLGIEKLLRNGHELWLSRQVLREYAAVLTRPQTYARPIASSDLTRQLRLIESRFRVAEESALVTAKLFDLMDQIPVGGKQIHDANIVATMLVHGVTHLFTLNVADFQRYAALITILSLEDVLKLT